MYATNFIVDSGIDIRWVILTVLIIIVCLMGILISVGMLSIKKLITNIHTNERRFASLFDHTPHAAISLDESGTVTKVNERFSAMLGYVSSEVIGRKYTMMLNEKVRVEAFHRFNTMLNEGSTTIETVWKHKAGHPINLRITVIPILEEEHIFGMYLLCRDITQELVNVELMARSQQIVETMTDAVFLKKDGIITFANRAAEKLLAAEHKELVGKSILEFSTTELHEHVVEMTGKMSLHGESATQESTFKRADGSTFDAQVTYMPFIHKDNSRGIQMIVKDVTDIKQKEIALRESEEKYRIIANYTSDLVFVMNEQGTVLYASPSHIPVLGFHPSEYEGKSAFAKINPDEVGKSKEVFQKNVALKKEFLIQTKIMNSDGEYKDFEFNVTPAVGDDGEIINIVVVGREVTKRLKMEKSLKESKEALDYAQRVAKIGNFTYNLTTREISCSEGIKEIVGYDLQGSSLSEISKLIHKSDRAMYSSKVQNVIDGETVRFEHRITIHDTVRFVESHLEPIFDKDGVVYSVFGTVQDITESKLTDELLRRTDKLSLAGNLAAGVAHEIRNPLTAIKGFLQFASTIPLTQDYLDIMLSEVNRMDSIIKDFLSFSKPHATTFKEADLDQLLGEINTLLGTQAIMKSISIKKTGEKVPHIVCDEYQLKQVFMNLLKNSIEAMSDGGVIEIKTVVLGNHVSVQIIDQGTGIIPERLAKLGEPFYSTKEKGTGLGLMVSNKIIAEHQGHLTFESEVGQGTVATVLLPLTAGSNIEKQQIAVVSKTA